MSAAPRIIPFAPANVMPDLYQSYMPFVQGGGIFIPTDEPFVLGEKCLLILKIPDRDEISIVSQVVWVTIAGKVQARGSLRGSRWRRGVGLRFTGKEGLQAKVMIDKTLGRHLASSTPTLTF